MNGIIKKIRHLIFRLRHDFLSIENLVLILAIALCLIWTHQSILAMSRNWALIERLGTEKQSLALLEVEVETMALENEYYKTEEYQELAARKFLNKQLAGEHMVYLPENSPAAKAKHQVGNAVVEKTYTNFEKWQRFLFPDYH